MQTTGRCRFLVGAALLTVVALLAGPAGCREQTSKSTSADAARPKKLVVLTPHSESIRRAFSAGFSSWCLNNRKTLVHVEWIPLGTPQCVEYVRSAPERKSEFTPGEMPDLLFGGGIGDHSRLAAEKLSLPLDLKDVLADIPADIRGVPTRDPDGRWIATDLSSFGIVYNNRACTERGIAPPKTWADLADPRFFGWIAVADPRASSSHRECLALIVQHEGLDPGWATIIRILGNARALNARSGDALRQVESGMSLATFGINFDGMTLAAQSDGAVQYIEPPGASALSPNLISLLKMSANPDLAKDFARYVLSEEGQTLWAVKRDRGDTLYHYAISPHIYEIHAQDLAVERNPFTADFGLPFDPEQVMARGRQLTTLVGAACAGSNHVKLQQAWQALIDAKLPAEPLAQLTAPLGDLPATSQPATRPADAAPDAGKPPEEWVAKFAEKYAKVLGLTGKKQP